MKQFSNQVNWYQRVPYGILLITLMAVSNINLKKDYANGSMEVDGKGYYAYLPAVFIYHDLSFSFYNEIERIAYNNPDYYYEYRQFRGDKTINRYYAGTAVCMSPFFLLAHGFTLITGGIADGYSYYYMLFVHMGALIYMLIGLLALQRILRTYAIAEKWIALTLAAISFGTNLFYYTLTEYSMSHVYSFAAVSLFLLVCRNYFLHRNTRLLLWAGFLLGLIVLIRPVNVVILMGIPFISGSINSFNEGIRNMLKQKVTFLIGSTAFLAMVSIQLIIYKIQTGNFLVYSYEGFGFNFLKPHFADMLFSYRKGLFVYTPIALFSLAGIYLIWKQNRFTAFSLLTFLILLVYLLSSWDVWYYGGSFSQRVFVEYYAFFAIPLAFALQNLPRGWIKRSYVTTVIVLTLFCQVQTYQYRHMIIHWSDMTKEKYWDVFLKITR